MSAQLDHQRLLQVCQTRQLGTWEIGFVDAIRRRRSPPTDRQMAILRRIARGAPNYAAINAAAIRALTEILPRWLPGGTQAGGEYVVRNPKRGDRTPGSFTVNTRTGKWADFATGDRGGDPISLAAFLFNLSQAEAARRVGAMLGINAGEGSSHG